MGVSDKKNANPILKGLSEVMKHEGFKKKASNWYQHNDETIIVVNLQNSVYGSLKYINFGIWIKKLADQEYLETLKKDNTVINGEYPREYQCHISFRPIHFPESIKLVSKEVFNLNSTQVTDEEREKYIIAWLNQYEIPILKQCSTIKGIKEALNEDKFKGALVYWKVKGRLSE